MIHEYDMMDILAIGSASQSYWMEIMQVCVYFLSHNSLELVSKTRHIYFADLDYNAVVWLMPFINKQCYHGIRFLLHNYLDQKN